MDSAKENPKVPLLTFLHMFLWFNELFSKSNICCVARYQIPKQSYSWQQKRTPKICKMLSLNTSCKEWILQTPAQWHIIRCCKSVTAILEFFKKPFQQSFVLIPGQNTKAELLQLTRTQFPSLGIFISKKVGNRKNDDHFYYIGFKSCILGGLSFADFQLFY